MNKTLSATKKDEAPTVTSPEGGKPIVRDVAIELVNVVFGALSALSRSPWFKSAFTFRDADSNLSFGLLAQTNEPKGLVMCVQAYVLKNLLFQGRTGVDNKTRRHLVCPSASEQHEALVLALADVLWKASGRGERPVVTCMPHVQAHLTDDKDFRSDGVTERIHVYEFQEVADVRTFFRSHLHDEAKQASCLLVVYSIVLTKGIAKLRTEVDGETEQLLTPRGECTQALINLMLTGSATPYTHNGAVYEDDEFVQGKTKVGILERSEIGFLSWQWHDPDGSLVGSRLKTPCLPIWVTKAGNQFGVLFNGSRELTRDYHAERHFDIYYYSSSRSQDDVIYLSIDTKSIGGKEERDVPVLERLIRTKWHEANVFWNGTSPFV